MNQIDIAVSDEINVSLPIEYIARFAYKIIQAYCLAIGDNTQTSWNDIPDWKKETVIDGVKFHLNNPNATPEQSHENWKKHKIQQGWVYGPTKDDENKTHPCIVDSYSDLPLKERVKDYLFAQTVRNFLLTSIK